MKNRKKLIKRIGYRQYQNIRTRLLVLYGRKGLAKRLDALSRS